MSKKLNIKTISCGYYSSFYELLAYASYPDEWLSKFKPNYIVCSNDICEKLVLQGVPKRIKIVSDLQESLIDIDQRNNENKNLLVFCLYFQKQTMKY